jgi:hypothetical protein
VTQGAFDHTAKIQQNGGGSPDFAVSAKVHQSGTVKDEAIITQNGGSLSATVAQSGASHNIATINLATIYGGTADITQIGTGGVNTATVNETSAWGFARVVQNGANLTTTINQSGDALASAATVEQTGSDHKAMVGQGQSGFSEGFGGNGATIRQSGTNNDAQVEQASYDGGMGAMITQNGSNHKAVVAQPAGGYSTKSTTIEQSADGHNAQVTQNGDGGQSGGTSTAFIRGTGANTAIVEQTDWMFMFADSTVIQEGTGNLANTLQMSTEGHHNSTIEQHGDNHQTTVHQFGISDNSSIVIAHGSGLANITQNSSFGSSTSAIEQSGENQQATIDQEAIFHDNSSTLFQSGADNIASIRQQGGDGGLNLSQLAMDGTGNTVSVTQLGNGFSFEGTQNASQITVQGTGNMVTVKQGQ